MVKKKKSIISVTDLASYAADKEDFIHVKTHGINAQAKKFGDDFHQGLSKQGSVFYYVLFFIGVIAAGLVLYPEFFTNLIP